MNPLSRQSEIISGEPADNRLYQIKSILMPAYSFQERFVPFVDDGSKTQTIRKRRKGQAKPGDTVYCYFGMRTKYCRKIREGWCLAVQEVRIYSDGRLYINSTQILGEFRDVFAWLDGFRPEGSSLQNPAGAFELMHRFWKQTHALPFIGDVIYWRPKP